MTGRQFLINLILIFFLDLFYNRLICEALNSPTKKTCIEAQSGSLIKSQNFT